MKIIFFDQRIEDFVSNLEKSTFAKTLRTLDLLEKYGSNLGMPHSKKIDAHLYELRIRGKTEIRFIYTFYQRSAVLLHAFIKKNQRIPKKALNLARKRLSSLDHA